MKNNPYLPIGVGFAGISIPLFISMIYASTFTERISIFICGIIFLIIGILIIIPKKRRDK